MRLTASAARSARAGRCRADPCRRWRRPRRAAPSAMIEPIANQLNRKPKNRKSRCSTIRVPSRSRHRIGGPGKGQNAPAVHRRDAGALPCCRGAADGNVETPSASAPAAARNAPPGSSAQLHNEKPFVISAGPCVWWPARSRCAASALRIVFVARPRHCRTARSSWMIPAYLRQALRATTETTRAVGPDRTGPGARATRAGDQPR